MEESLLLPIGFEYSSPHRPIYTYNDVYNFLYKQNNQNDDLTIKKINELWLNNNKIILINLSKPLQPELQIDTFKNEMKDLEKAEKLLKYLEEIEKEEE